jgi:hypothetical protein
LYGGKGGVKLRFGTSAADDGVGGIGALRQPTEPKQTGDKERAAPRKVRLKHRNLSVVDSSALGFRKP